MEEILASIRRIISEDDAPASEADAAPDHEPEPQPVAAAPEAPADDVLELTDRIDGEADTVGDITAYPAEEPKAAAPEPAPPPKPAPLATVTEDDRLVSDVSARAAASAFGQLSAAVAMPADAQTLDGVVRDLLRPLLKDWLDRHLPAIVEAKVSEEVERIARSRVR